MIDWIIYYQICKGTNTVSWQYRFTGTKSTNRKLPQESITLVSIEILFVTHIALKEIHVENLLDISKQKCTSAAMQMHYFHPPEQRGHIFWYLKFISNLHCLTTQLLIQINTSHNINPLVYSNKHTKNLSKLQHLFSRELETMVVNMQVSPWPLTGWPIIYTLLYK